MTDSQPGQESAALQHSFEEVAHFLDVPMSVVIQLGQRSMKVREVLLLKPESIVELPKSAGENVDIYINGKLIAFGEVLQMEGSAGIRITDVFSET
jgi:flagellar motor switch protein FliN/FliY